MPLRSALPLVMYVCYIVKLSGSNRWPAGSYGIPKCTSGCPRGVGFMWETGWRYQDTGHSNNGKSQQFHLDGYVNDNGVRRSFCLKDDTTNDQNRTSWPPGKYCLYKKGPCAKETAFGYVHWDDEDWSNENKKGGKLPSGTYNVDTTIFFCCRITGDKNNPISLPTEVPFFLLAYESAECQQVKWALATVEWIKYAHYSYSITQGGAYPYGAGLKSRKHIIHYCYYQGCNETLNNSSGTFHSPNYPQNYPDGQYCSWRIMASLGQLIYLKFTNFTLQSENNTDAVYVYNGENETREAIGVFYGGHPPPQEGIKSSSNNLFVIFKSDVNGSFTGFNASYYAVNYSEPSTTATSPPTSQVTSPYQRPSGSESHSLSSTESVLLGETLPPSDVPKGQVHKARTGIHTSSLRKGVKMAAIVIPLVGCVMAAFLVGGLLYFQRKKRRNSERDDTPKVLYQNSDGSAVSVATDNKSYERYTSVESLISENVLYASHGEEDSIYSDIKNERNKYDHPKLEKESENPLYEAMPAEGTADKNHVYDSMSWAKTR